jgi:hypothetical protein
VRRTSTEAVLYCASNAARSTASGLAMRSSSVESGGRGRGLGRCSMPFTKAVEIVCVSQAKYTS